MPYVLGIDLGGTKILAGIVNTETGKVLGTGRKRTHVERGGSEVLERAIHAATEAIDTSGIKQEDLTAVGIGVAGQVDTEEGTLIRAPNLPEGLLGSGLSDHVRDEFHLPITLANDVAAAAAGEAGQGAGRGHPDFVCIFAGTGIGGAIYRDGKPYVGTTHTAGELGHMVIDIDGRICGCGGRGHLEAYASRTSIVRTILGEMRLGNESVLSELEPDPDPERAQSSAIRSRALADAVRSGDALATNMIEEGARYMGAGLVSIINFYNPPRIILGGGIVDAVDLFFQTASAYGHREALQVPRRHVEIVKAALGDNSGIVGAALLAGHRALRKDR